MCFFVGFKSHCSYAFRWCLKSRIPEGFFQPLIAIGGSHGSSSLTCSIDALDSPPAFGAGGHQPVWCFFQTRLKTPFFSMTEETKSESLQIVGFAKESRFSYYASPSSAYQYTFIHDLFPKKTLTTLLPHYHYIAFSVPLLYAYSNSPYHFWYSYTWYIIYIYMYRAKHTALATSSLVHYIPLYNPWKSPYNFAVHNSIQKLWCLCLKILYPQTNSHQNRGRITNHQLPGFSPNFSEPLDSPNTHQKCVF